MRTAIFVAAALVCFAANSLLTRGALGRDLLDAPTFTIVRLATGAAMLAILLRARRATPAQAGTWKSALALAGYAVAFTLAYTRIEAGVGALLLFGAVQVTMIATGLLRGERPLVLDWLGLLLAVSGLAWMTLPGSSGADLLGSMLMIAAGASWGAYSIIGRGSRDPLSATAGNFWRATIFGVVALGVLYDPGAITGMGLLLAAASGALASGVGYTFWYSALPHLTAWRAALLQLPVPIITALAAVLILGESFTSRLLIATLLVCGGVGLTLIPSRRTSSTRGTSSRRTP